MGLLLSVFYTLQNQSFVFLETLGGYKFFPGNVFKHGFIFISLFGSVPLAFTLSNEVISFI